MKTMQLILGTYKDHSVQMKAAVCRLTHLLACNGEPKENSPFFMQKRSLCAAAK